RQIRAEVRVVRQAAAPAPDHVLDLAHEARLLVGRVLVAAAERLVVIELGVRRPHVPVAALLDPQAEVDVVERDGEMLLLEPAHPPRPPPAARPGSRRSPPTPPAPGARSRSTRAHRAGARTGGARPPR